MDKRKPRWRGAIKKQKLQIFCGFYNTRNISMLQQLKHPKKLISLCFENNISDTAVKKRLRNLMRFGLVDRIRHGFYVLSELGRRALKNAKLLRSILLGLDSYESKLKKEPQKEPLNLKRNLPSCARVHNKSSKIYYSDNNILKDQSKPLTDFQKLLKNSNAKCFKFVKQHGQTILDYLDVAGYQKKAENKTRYFFSVVWNCIKNPEELDFITTKLGRLVSEQNKKIEKQIGIEQTKQKFRAESEKRNEYLAATAGLISKLRQEGKYSAAELEAKAALVQDGCSPMMLKGIFIDNKIKELFNKGELLCHIS